MLSCLEERREDRRDECLDEVLLRRDSLSDLILSILLGPRLLLLTEPGLGDRLGVAVPGLGVRLLLGLGEGLLLLLAFVL